MVKSIYIPLERTPQNEKYLKLTFFSTLLLTNFRGDSIVRKIIVVTSFGDFIVGFYSSYFTKSFS